MYKNTGSLANPGIDKSPGMSFSCENAVGVSVAIGILNFLPRGFLMC